MITAHGYLGYIFERACSVRWPCARLAAFAAGASMLLAAAAFGSLALIPAAAFSAVGHEYLSQLTEVPPLEHLAVPDALAAGTSGNVWVADLGKGAVDEFDASGIFVQQIGSGFGAGGKGFDIAVAPTSEDLYVAESAKGVVDILKPTGEFLKELTGANTPQENFGKGSQPIGVAIDQSTGNVYVINNHLEPKKNQVNPVVDEFNSAGTFQCQWGIPGETISMAASAGDLYVLFTGGGNNIAKYEACTSTDDPPDGIFLSSFGKGGVLTGEETPVGNFGFETREGGQSEFVFEAHSGIAVGSGGDIYVADSDHKVVDQFDATGKYLGQINGGATPAHETGTPGHELVQNFIDPVGVAVNSSGDVYVSDFNPVSGKEGVVDVFKPEVTQDTLTVSVTGGVSVSLGEGKDSSVSSSPAGIEETQICRGPPFTGCNGYASYVNNLRGCEEICSAQFDPNTKVALMANPASGFELVDWLVGVGGTVVHGCSGIELKCEIEIGAANVEVKAQYAASVKYPLEVKETGSGSGEVTSEPPGIKCPSDCSAPFSEGGRVTFKEAPGPTSEFVGWRGCESESADKVECTVTMTGPESVAAEFKAIPQETLAIAETGNGSGKITSKPSGLECPPICSAFFNEGERVTFKEAPGPTSEFVGWRGCESESADKVECTVTMTGPESVAAEFKAIPQKTLITSASGSGSGVIRSSPTGIDCGAICSHEFNEGTVVELTARPDSTASVFAGWSGGGCSGVGICVVTLAVSTEVTAVFAAVTPAACPNEQLRTEQPYGLRLPDCRAYELVSPINKNDNDAVSLGELVDRAAVSGEAVVYESKGSFASPVGANYNSAYISRRALGGWSTQNITPSSEPDAADPLGGQFAYEGFDFTPNLSAGVVIAGDPPLSSNAPAGYESLYVDDFADDSYQFVGATDGAPYEFLHVSVQLDESSVDLSHVVFEKSEKTGIFEWVDGKVSTVASKAQLGGGRGDAWHALSADGSRVIFTREEGGFDNVEGQLFVRENEGEPVEVSASQKTNGSGSKGTDPNASKKPFAHYRGASLNGSRVFFSSSVELTNDANTGSADSAENLYEYNLESKALTDLTVDKNPDDAEGAAVLGVVEISKDGSYVYFVAAGYLANGAMSGQPNLYLSHDGMTTLIATLDSEDSSDWDGNSQKITAAVSEDGTRLAFQSGSSLTGYDNEQVEPGECESGEETGRCHEIYLYDAETGRISCVSCNPSGERPIGPSSLYSERGLSSKLRYIYKPFSFSADDSRLFFQSSDALVSHDDNNGRQNVYEYENGFVSLLSNGAGNYDSYLMDVSASGNDVFIATADRLVSQDQDGNIDVYDVRVDGGFPAVPSLPPACDNGDSCRPPESPQPGVFGEPGSATFSGAGDLSPQPPPMQTAAVKKATKCKKGFVKKKGKCVRKARPRKKAKKSTVSSRRRK